MNDKKLHVINVLRAFMRGSEVADTFKVMLLSHLPNAGKCRKNVIDSVFKDLTSGKCVSFNEAADRILAEPKQDAFTKKDVEKLEGLSSEGKDTNKSN